MGWATSLVSSTTYQGVPERALEAFRKRLPKCRLYVLTQWDLNVGNIMVESGRLAGILDWEYAGYFPIWWEYVGCGVEEAGSTTY